MSAVAPAVSRRFSTAGEVAAQSWADLEPLRRRLAQRLAFVTPLGWGVVAAGLASWIFGVELGWQELELGAAACLVVLVLAAAFTIGRAELAIAVNVAPPRVVVGEPAAGEVIVRNLSGRRLIPLPVELPVGAGLARFDLPPLQGGGEYDDAFVVPTARRAVIPVGPAKSVRSDPLGLFRREIVFSEMIELFVHPQTALMESLGSGFLRDLEGNTTDAISPSDLAFHSLRNYVPGDDRRHVHWRTTARMASGDLMVRQFLDTRRSHLVVVLDTAHENYATEEEFELAVSAAASFALRGVRDEQEVTVVPGRQVAARGAGVRLLDAFSRAEMAEQSVPLERLAAYAADACGDASLVILATGSQAELGRIRRAARRFDLEAAVVGLVASSDGVSALQSAGGLKVMRIGALSDLARVAQGAART